MCSSDLGAGDMSRLYGTEKVYDMLTGAAKDELKKQNVGKANFGHWLEENPDFDLHAHLDHAAVVDGFNDTAWWGLKSEGKAGNVTQLIDALALDPEYYPSGGVRFNITAETAHAAGMTKPTAFDGMFAEWVATDVKNDFGVTGGGKREGVVGRIGVAKVGSIELFGGTPEQLVTKRASTVGKLLAGDADGAAVVSHVVDSGASKHLRASFLKDLEEAVRKSPGVGAKDLHAAVVATKPEYAAFALPGTEAAKPASSTPTPHRTPPPELAAQGQSLIDKARARAGTATDADKRKGAEAAAVKIQQILDEQAPGVTDALKKQFLTQLEAKFDNPANAGKDTFDLVREIGRAHV